MDFDDPGSPEPQHDPVELEDDLEEWGRERSQTPVYDTDKAGKPRKRLVKKASSGKETDVPPELVDDDDEGDFDRDFGMDGSGSEERKRKRLKEGKKEKRPKEKKRYEEKGSGSRSGKSQEMKEMWQWVNPEVVYFSFLHNSSPCAILSEILFVHESVSITMRGLILI